MMVEFNLSDRQAEAILNMRLRSLRKLEEMQIRSERDKLLKERAELEKLIESPSRQRNRLKKDLAALRDRYGTETELGRRRTRIRSEEHTSELQSLMRISYAVFCLKKKKTQQHKKNTT